MPTGPFRALGRWPVVREHHGGSGGGSASAHVVVVKATRQYVKYTRKCARTDPSGARVRHARIYRWDATTYRASLGGFERIEARLG